jgi:hypothetical protein
MKFFWTDGARELLPKEQYSSAFFRGRLDQNSSRAYNAQRLRGTVVQKSNFALMPVQALIAYKKNKERI